MLEAAKPETCRTERFSVETRNVGNKMPFTSEKEDVAQPLKSNVYSLRRTALQNIWLCYCQDAPYERTQCANLRSDASTDFRSPRVLTEIEQHNGRSQQHLGGVLAEFTL